MGLLSHRVERRDILAGDHIYTWKAAFAYSHHGIYLGGNKLVHFSCKQNLDPGIYVGGNKIVHFTPQQYLDSESSPISSSASSSKVSASPTCPNFPDCGFKHPGSGVVLSCLECFLANGLLHLFQYGVSPSVFLAKLRGGTSTTAKSDPPQVVIDRAMYLLQNGFGTYHLFDNNCEDFALYCKTGLLVHDPKTVGKSGQAASAFGAPLSALLSSPLQSFISCPLGFVTATAMMYCVSRYATDVGVRPDVIKVKVEEVPFLHDRKRRKEELAKSKMFLEEELDSMDALPSKRQKCS